MKTDAKLTAVREAHRFDEDSMGEYLQNKLEGYAGPLSIQQFEGLWGQKICPSQKTSR
jgi:hypothetical protein